MKTLTHKRMYRALVNKDSSYEGIFFAAVKTTNIFCRPTCPARRPKPEHVEFFQSAKEALLHGYRPCKVCKPLEAVGAMPAFIQKLLEEITKHPSKRIGDADLICQRIEPNKVRRWFKANVGVTFAAYQRMSRMKHAYEQLSNGQSVTQTAFDSGYDSLSGFADAFRNLVGDAPSNAHTAKIIVLRRITTPLGPMIAGATDDGICLLEFADRRMLRTELKALQRHFRASVLFGNNAHVDSLERQLREYFDGERKRFDLTLVTPGTGFQQLVWRKLQDIPYGETKSYKRQAEAIGKPEAVRAVANANGCNRIAIVIPCHRVIGEDGKLHGYGGGVWRKKWLLEMERKSFDNMLAISY